MCSDDDNVFSSQRRQQLFGAYLSMVTASKPPLLDPLRNTLGRRRKRTRH
jgi:hypothetical protein